MSSASGKAVTIDTDEGKRKANAAGARDGSLAREGGGGSHVDRNHGRARRFLYENGLSLTAFALFAVCLVGQVIAGHAAFNQDQLEHGQRAIEIGEYLLTGHFIEATFENWESEFLQLSAFVLLTVMLRQKGSPESKTLEGGDDVDEDPREAMRSAEKRAVAPSPVRRGGLVLRLYEHSLSLALLLFFAISLALHALGGVADYNEEQRAHGGEPVSAIAYLRTSRFWFESFQNWQSEFLAVGALIVMSIWLRERGSAMSKPVAAPHDQTDGK